MDQDPQKPNELDTVPVRTSQVASSPQRSSETTKTATSYKITNPSSTTAQLVMLLAGVYTLCSSSYLAARVLYRLLVEKDTSFLFFDLSPFDLYAVISLAMFALLYFLAARRAEKSIRANTNKSYTISSIWQALLVVTIVGSIVSLIYSPVSAAFGLEWNSDQNTGAVIAYEMLSSLFVTVLSSIFLFREWLLAKNRSTLLPMIVSLGLILIVIIPAVMFILQPKEQKQDNLYPPYDYETDQSLSDRAEDSQALTNANNLAKKAEAYSAAIGEYPTSITDFAKTPESKLDSGYSVITERPTTPDEVQYKRCSSGSDAQVIHYVTSTGSTKITALGDASSTVAC